MYLYETHLHTSQTSVCGRSSGHEYIKWYRDNGYAGIMVTDHFFGGNCAVDAHLPWRERINRFCAGYEEAKNEGDKHGLPVFFGWEETFDGDDYLIYGLDKAWLLAHPEAAMWDRKTQHEKVRQNNGCVIQAHPFREQSYIQCIHLNYDVDGVEVYNASNAPYQNALAEEYAALLGVAAVAGSDAHSVARLKEQGGSGVFLDRKLETIGDYVDIIKSKIPIGHKRLPDAMADATIPELLTPMRLWGDFPAGIISRISALAGNREL